MNRLIDRRAALCTGLATAGGLWLPGSLRASDLPAGQLLITNDYDQEIAVAVFHPDDLAKQFAMWPSVAARNENVPLYDRQNKPFIVGPDWGVRVYFKNGAKSPVQRIINVGGSANQDGKIVCTASRVVNTKVGYSLEYDIKVIKGYTIDKQFGKKETELLTNALAIFYKRFVQLHWTLMPELFTKAGTRFGDNFPSADFMGVDDARDYLGRQLGRMASSAGPKPDAGDIFPHLTLNFANQAGANWIARAPVGTVQVHMGRAAGRYEGAFEMQINTAYLFNRAGAYYSDCDFWAGVIAHEALHNLGHRHPDLRTDLGYYQYQMILIESMVMSGGQVRYGDKNPTPVMCGGTPRG